MNKTPIALGLVAATAATAAFAISVVDVATGSPSARAEVLALHFNDSAPDASTDGGKPGPSVGDQLFFAGELREGGQVLARADILGPRAALFNTTIKILGRGTVAAQGRLDFQRKHQGRLAILGGTGDFAGADGTVDVDSGKRQRITFTLTLQ